MQTIFQPIFITLFATAVLAFLGSAFVRPKLFSYLIKPVIITLGACILLTIVFAVGLLVGHFITSDSFQGLSNMDARNAASDAIWRILVYASGVIGTCFFLQLTAFICIFPANRQLLEDHEKSLQVNAQRNPDMNLPN